MGEAGILKDSAIGRLGEQKLEERAFEERPGKLIAFLQSGAEVGVGRVQGTPHARVLRPLAGKHPDDAWSGRRHGRRG